MSEALRQVCKGRQKKNKQCNKTSAKSTHKRKSLDSANKTYMEAGRGGKSSLTGGGGGGFDTTAEGEDGE
jgi:hypothetical protein